MSNTMITFLVLAAVVVVFVWDRLPVAIVAARALRRGRGAAGAGLLAVLMDDAVEYDAGA